ncbi:MAG: glycosyltransferase [Wenzhouxiangellaceae bacterium]|nr:glycosyltransferase [Wenzhouxiangellaceae bacterium]
MPSSISTTEPETGAVARVKRRIAADSLLGQTCALIVFVALTLGLLVPKVAGAAFLLLGALGVIWLEPGLLRGRWVATRDERLLTLSVLAFVGVWLLAWLGHGLDEVGFDDVGRILRLLLIVPIYSLLSRVDGLERAWWSGLAAGALLAGAYALAFALSGHSGEWAERVGGSTNPIYFGGVVLAFALMLLPRVADGSLPAWKRLIAVAAVALGLLASAMSGSRGAWLALPPLLALYAVTLATRLNRHWQIGIPMGLLGMAVLLALLPGVPLGERFGELLVTDLRGTPDPGDTLAIRWALWELSLAQLAEHWAFGLGPGGFREALEQAIAAGTLPAWFDEYHHPHNQYLSALLIAGVPGLATLLLLFGVSARRFALLWSSGLERTRLIGWSGLAAVTVLAVMALSESVFQRNSGIIWLGLLIACAHALVKVRQRHELEARPAERVHTLSVIMICRDEADRIERALKSVAGWADQIVVLDSGSSDETVSICRRYTDQVEVTDWPGFGRQKQRALERATGDWILSLDADEWLGDTLRREIDLVLSRPHPHYCGYRIPWLTHAFDATLRFGRWSRAPLRLARRDAVRFTDAPVHEKLVPVDPAAPVGRLQGVLHHQVFRSEQHARTKLAGYAELQAEHRRRAGRRATRSGARLRAALNWIDNMLLHGAVLDGPAGWRMSRIQARYTLDKYQRLAALSRRR